MERDGAPAVATFFAPETPVAGVALTLGDDAAHHMRVRRMGPPDRVRLVDGVGTVAHGTLIRLSRSQAAIEVESARETDAQPPVHVLIPIGDRDRMLWLAEKCAELGATTWRPVLWRRSRSVQPRGEGVTFQAKVRARMIGALEQSGNPWLPSIHPDAPPDRALAALPEGSRFALDHGGVGFLGCRPVAAPLVLAVGPEGGFEESERAMLADAGFVSVSISANVLRFETAGAAGLAMARAMLDSTADAN